MLPLFLSYFPSVCLLYLIALSLSFLFYFYRFFPCCVSPFLSYIVAYVSVDVSSNKEESNSDPYVPIRLGSIGPAVQQRQQITRNLHSISSYKSVLSYCFLRSLCSGVRLSFCIYRACTVQLTHKNK